MRKLLVFALMLTFVGTAMAYDLGNDKPAKPVVDYPQNVPSGQRQGGDTILDAVMVTLPVEGGTGTTIGYVNDYDEVCPYSGSTSPDVVYSFVADVDQPIDVDLLGSDYDTKVYVYDENLVLIACNDDFYSDYVSKIEQMPVVAGVMYYVVVDGYGGDAGNYVISIIPFEPCVIECPAGAQLEGEPPLVDGYADAWNGGCNSPEFGNPFQPITEPLFCGVSGWYINADGGQSRDTDWFEIIIPESGVLEITADAEFATYTFELGPQDCGSVGVVQNIPCGPCTPGEMFISGAAGSTVWYWVGPQTFDGEGEYTYVLELNIEGTTAVENHSWTGVKALFN